MAWIPIPKSIDTTWMQTEKRKTREHPVDMTLVPWREMGKYFSILVTTLLQDGCAENMNADNKGTPLRTWGLRNRDYAPTGTQSLHKPYSKHAPFPGRLCCFSKNPKRRVAGCPIMNKTADRNGKSLWRICKPKIPYVESEHFIYTSAWYFAHAHRIMEEIYGCLLAQNSLRPYPTGLQGAPLTLGQVSVVPKSFPS